MSEKVTHITDDMFETEVIASDVPVLVDFWAPWCGPCKMVGPELEKLAQELEGRLKITKINVDENRATAEKFGIMSIPTLILFKNKGVVKKMVGAMASGQIREAIEAEL